MEEKKQELYSLTVSVWDPNKLLYKGDCESVTTTNDKGIFDILPVHENFITIIKGKVIVRSKEGKMMEYPVEKGILKVEENVVDIFLGTETL